jgi:hypothetical protein
MLIELTDTGYSFVEDVGPPPLPIPRYATSAGAKRARQRFSRRKRPV